jgi:hypothetical protein
MANTMKEAKTPRELITPFILALAIDSKLTVAELPLICMPVITIFIVFVFIYTFQKSALFTDSKKALKFVHRNISLS